MNKLVIIFFTIWTVESFASESALYDYNKLLGHLPEAAAIVIAIGKAGENAWGRGGGVQLYRSKDIPDTWRTNDFKVE